MFPRISRGAAQDESQKAQRHAPKPSKIIQHLPVKKRNTATLATTFKNAVERTGAE